MAKDKNNIWALLTRDLGSTSTKKPGAYRGPRYLRTKARTRALLEITNILATLTKTNYPLVEGLHMAALESKNVKIRASLEALAHSIGVGFNLWEAMAAQRRFYPSYYVDIVRAAETTGALPSALKDLITTIQSERDFRNAIAVPLFMIIAEFIVATHIIIFLLLFVFPTFAQIGNDFSTEFTGMTQLLLYGTESAYMNPVFWRVAPLAIVALVVLVLILIYLGMFRGLATRIGLLIPVLRRALQEASLGHASIILAQLLRARIPLDEALVSVSEGSLSPYYRKRLKKVSDHVANGLGMGDALAKTPGIPPTYTAQIAIAESAEDLPAALESLGYRYQTRSHTRRHVLVQVILPLFTLLLGSIVLAMELAVFGLVVALSDYMSAPI